MIVDSADRGMAVGGLVVFEGYIDGGWGVLRFLLAGLNNLVGLKGLRYGEMLSG